MKLLKIEGVKEIIVSGCDIRCPLNCLNVKCKIGASIDVENHHYGEFPTDCPLPEYVTENEHTAPDGTELVAELSVSMDCVGCHYDVNDKCTCEEEKHFCIPSERRDKRFVRYVKKSEVK